MARIYKNIIQAMNDHLIAFSAGAFSTKISWEGQTFSPPAKATWLEQVTLFTTPSLLGLFSDAGTYREQGIYQITVNTGLDGAITATDVADALCEYFPRGSSYSSGGTVVRVEKSWKSSGKVVSPHYKVPVSVEFWAYAQYN